MAKYPYMPWYPRDFLTDTQTLTLEEKGAYRELLDHAWLRPNCDLPDDDKFLAKLLKIDIRRWRKLRPSLIDFWQTSDGMLWQKRQRELRKVVGNTSRKQSQIAHRRWNKNNGLADATAMPEAMPKTTPELMPRQCLPKAKAIEDTISTSPLKGEVEIVSSGTIAKFPAANVRANGSGNGADHGAASAAREGAGNGSEAEGPALQRQPPAPAQAVAALAIASASGFDPSKPITEKNQPRRYQAGGPCLFDTRPAAWEYIRKRFWKSHWRVEDLDSDPDRRKRYDAWLAKVKRGEMEGREPYEY